MTRSVNARLAGFMFLFYIATALPAMILFDKATGGGAAGARLSSIAGHVPEMRLVIVFSVITIFDALVLAVALYAITREADRDLAVLALSCRAGEGIVSAIPTLAMVGLLWLATGTVSTDAASANAMAALLLRVQSWSTIVSATLFAAGSTLFSFLFLRARTIPGALAWLGLAASVLLVFALPAQLAGFIRGATGWLAWIPMLLFEITLGFWLLIKGVAAPVPATS